MGLKAKVEAIIYAAEEPITAEQISVLLKDMVLAQEAEERAKAEADAQEAAEQGGEPPVEPAAEGVVAENTEADPATAGLEPASESAPEVETEAESAAADTPGETESTTEATETAAEAHPAEEPAAEFTPVPADPRAAAAPAEADAQASVTAPESVVGKRKKASKKELTEDGRVTAKIRTIIEELIADYQNNEDRGMEIKAVAGGYRMATKPEHHDVVRAFAKSLKPPIKFSLAALETLAVIAYKQPITVPEITEIRGVESGGVIGTLLDRKLITTAGRKQVVGRPILYKTSKEFLLRFGLGGLADLPSMEEFEKLASAQEELFTAPAQEIAEPIVETEQEATVESTPEMPEAQAPDEESPAPETQDSVETSDGVVSETASEANVSDSVETDAAPAAEESQAANRTEPE